MKLLTFSTGDTVSFGATLDDGIVDLGRRLGARYPSIVSLLESADLPRIAADLTHTTPDYRIADVTFLPPIVKPESIFCIGINYRNRNREYGDDSTAPAFPSVFMRTAGSLVGHRVPIVRPPESDQLDYEGEIVIVIGKSGRRIRRERARDHIAGLTCMNEGTIRDWVRHGKFNVTQGKNFARSGSVGPWIATTDEFADFANLRVTTRVNGEIRQNDTTGNLAFEFEYLIEYLSTFAELKPGDLIATGTPTGAGARFEPPRFLRPGDVVEVEVEGVGLLSNTVVDEPLGASA